MELPVVEEGAVIGALGVSGAAGPDRRRLRDGCVIGTGSAWMKLRFSFRRYPRVGRSDAG